MYIYIYTNTWRKIISIYLSRDGMTGAPAIVCQSVDSGSYGHVVATAHVVVSASLDNAKSYRSPEQRSSEVLTQWLPSPYPYLRPRHAANTRSGA